MARSRKPPQLPVRQLIILSICRFAEPVALTSVFPYLPEMIESFNIPRNKVAKWAGITSAVFSLSQCVTGIAWGRASDRFGRKPVIMVGMICTMTASLLFGFSQSLPWAIVARSFAGASNGNVGIIRTTVAEMVPQKELQPRAFSVMPLVWTIGSILGPAFGGALSNPAEKHPYLFGSSEFFKKYPYALPNIAASMLFLVGLLTGLLFLKETLESKKHRRDYGRLLGELLVRPFTKKSHRARPKWGLDDEQASSLLKHSRMSSVSTINDGHQQQRAVQRQSPPGYREVFSRQSNINLLTYSLLALHSVAFDQLLPIFMHHPPQDHRSTNPKVQLPLKFAGGFGIDSERIGLLFTLYGICGMFIQFLIFPPIARRYGILPCLKVCTLSFPIAYAITPFTVLLPLGLMQQSAMFLVMLLKCWAVIFAFPCSTILLTNSAVSLRILGTLNGVATSVSAIGRAAGPAIGGWTFSLGVDLGYVIIPWWTLSALSALGAVPVWWLVEMEGFGGAGDSDSEDGDDYEGATLPNTDDEREAEGRSSALAKGRNTTAALLVPEEERQDQDQDQEEQADDFAIEEDDDDDDSHPSIPSKKLHKTQSPSSRYHQLTPAAGEIGSSARLARRMTSPLGMTEGIGPGGGRRLSNGLGQTRSGFGAGGTSYH